MHVVEILLETHESSNVTHLVTISNHYIMVMRNRAIWYEVKVTRTTRTPAFWGYPPPPHDYPHFWVMLDPKSKQGRIGDIGQGQRSSHATHLLMLVMICIKYGKNPSRTIDATERTRFSWSRPNDLENIGQGQRSLHATHPLMLMMICAKYGKNTSRIVDFFQGESRKIRKISEKSKF